MGGRLLDRQRQGVVLGAIRTGTKVVGANGKVRPERLETFRLTTPDRGKLDEAAALYGGEVVAWSPRDGAAGQWSLTTTVSRLPVRIPPGDAVDQAYELWDGKGRQRMCDGRTERMRGTECVCPPDLRERKVAALAGRACWPTTRVRLILADLPGLGVWLLTSKGDAAADEMAATAQVLQDALGVGTILPAVLRLEQRESRGSGELHRFAVPVLDVGTSLAALEAGRVPQVGLPSGPPRQALTAGYENLPPAPRDQPVAPIGLPVGAPASAQDLADLARSVGSVEQVNALGRVAGSRGWLGDTVATDASRTVYEPLEGYLRERAALLRDPDAP